MMMLCLPLAGCGELADQLDLSAEDMQDLEDAMEGLEDAIQDAAEGASGGEDGADGDGGEDGPDDDPLDPDWSPSDVPPPPGEPSQSADQSDESFCPAGAECGWASYDDDDGTAANEHYEDVFGRPPDETRRSPSIDDDGQPYDAVTNTWDDGDVAVTVYTDHHGTDVSVRQQTSP